MKINKSIKFEEWQINYIVSQTRNFSEWIIDAVNEKIKKREQLPDTLFNMGIFIKEMGIDNYIKKTIHAAKVDIKPDECKDRGVISFKLDCLPIDYELHFFYHMIYLKNKPSFYQFEMDVIRSIYNHEFYSDTSGSLSKIEESENELCKYVKEHFTDAIQTYQETPNDSALISGTDEILNKLK